MSESAKPDIANPTDDASAKVRIVQARIIERLNSKGAAGACPMCGVADQWTVGSFVTHTIGSTPAGAGPGDKTSYPTIAVFCANCGNTHFVNLIVLGFTAADWESLRMSPDTMQATKR
jgi:hypothetical protein